jgi:hypothetical protein
MKRAKARSRGIWPRHDAKNQVGRQNCEIQGAMCGRKYAVLGSFTKAKSRISSKVTKRLARFSEIGKTLPRDI